MQIALEGVIVASVEVLRDVPMETPTGAIAQNEHHDAARRYSQNEQNDEEEDGEIGLHGRIRIITRCMWIDGGRLLDHLQKAAEGALASSWRGATLPQIERKVATALRKASQKYINRRPEVIVIATEGSSTTATNTHQRSNEDHSVTVKSFPWKSQKWGDVKTINKVGPPSKEANYDQREPYMNDGSRLRTETTEDVLGEFVEPVLQASASISIEPVPEASSWSMGDSDIKPSASESTEVPKPVASPSAVAEPDEKASSTLDESLSKEVPVRKVRKWKKDETLHLIKVQSSVEPEVQKGFADGGYEIQV